jgi:calcium-dependent protein kinase
VNEATHKQSGKSYAIKIVNKYKLNKEDAKALQVEISILRELDQSHIVQLYDVFGDADYCYLVTEKLDGGNLYERIVKHGAYTEDDCRRACRTMFQALEYTHKCNVAHRDLKLENLLLTVRKTVIPILRVGTSLETQTSHLNFQSLLAQGPGRY